MYVVVCVFAFLLHLGAICLYFKTNRRRIKGRGKEGNVFRSSVAIYNERKQC